MNVSELITSKGFPCENHEVITEDGYILSLQRIPYGRHGNLHFKGSRPVVYLQHGLLGDATNWVTNLATQSLAFILADAGYDVWIGSNRGTTYSKGHVNLSSHDKKYWKFSWDDIAKYDLPAVINYALNVSGQSQLYYIGHSQGTTTGFAAFSKNKQLAKKIKLFIALAPVTTVGYTESPIRILADTHIYKILGGILNTLGVEEILPQNKLFEFIANSLCGNDHTVIVCESILFLIDGYDCHRMNASRIPVYVAHTPAGTSLKNIIHWAQMITSYKFQMYDYGVLGNYFHYGKVLAPEYNVSEMDVPVAVFWGEWDILADPTDVLLLIPKIRNLVSVTKIERFDHLDFIWAVDADQLLYKDVLKVLQNN
ncbi:gastric triacylglycerol lipase-like [Glandiceps talaboti]